MSPATAAPKPVVLWCHPRSISSAFERAFMQRADFKCLHEPYGEPFHYNLEERLSQRYSDDEIRQNHSDRMDITYGQITELLTAREDGKRIFSKDMAQYIVKLSGSSDGQHQFVVSVEDLRRMNHIFLIRSPELACPSYFRCCVGDAAKETSFSHYDPDEAGYRELCALFDHVRKHGFNGSNAVVVIDAETLTGDPEATLRYVCAQIGVDWDPKMLSWKSGRVEEFSKWPGFHKDAENSTGFKAKVNGNHKADGELPEIVHQTIKENMPVYEYLKGFAFKA
jgi:Sulfotransferase domain